MLKHTLLAVSLAALTVLPLPGVTGAAFAQRQPPTYQPPCTAGPQCSPKGEASGDTYTCTTELGHLRRVYEEELDGIEDPVRVAVVPVCMGESYGIMRSDGNAGALRQIIAGNDAMTEALFLKRFGSDDVVGVRMTDEDAVILYVHPFHQ